MLNTQSKILGVSIISAMLLLAGCGQDKAADGKGAEGKAQNVVRINNGDDPESLDPHIANDVGSFNIIRQMFLGLTTTDAEGKTIPSLATEWSNVDEKVWTFKLNPNAKWSNGEPLTAHDFVYSMLRLLDPKTASHYGTYLADAKVVNAAAFNTGKASADSVGIKALDDHTLQITLSEPVPYLAELLALPVAAPVHKATIEKFGEKWTDPANIVVSGAYTLEANKTGEVIRLKRNEKFYDNDKTSIDTVEFLPIQGMAAINQYKAGDIDLVGGVPPEQFEALKKELGEDQVRTAPNFCHYYLDYNFKKAPTNDVKVRQALNLTIDRDIVTKDMMKRGEIASYQFTPEIMQGLGKVTPVWATQDMATRAATAKKLLNEAGYNENNPLKVEILYTTSETGKMMTAGVSAMWKQHLGFVDTALVNQEWKVMQQMRHQGDFQISLGGWCADYNEPSSFLNMFRANNDNNNGKYNNPKFDSLLDATTAPDVSAEQRKDLYIQAERLLHEDVPAAYLFLSVGSHMIKPHLDAPTLKDPLHNWQVKDWKLKK
ncbi:peptide ABC transporter substrate-binding protein [Moraxella nasicaprae]|uniref:Peptide ABC transporter substrate-binding protein n=1 Tax=Moraxella nasicaprae TaxID=2904122 RepID=A0ABY6F656_9GAMM|nr:peptide ABC transporter substrate-binding protein [Moraxella nasicaprae]UXZ05432.1 peptide ABC transporter substrate-binding protein [Moraxella nasicaprae]